MKKIFEQSGRIEGVVGIAVVDYTQAVCLADNSGGGGWTAEAVAHVDLVRAELAAVHGLRLPDELEDILITLSTQYHLIRVFPTRPQTFLYLTLDRQSGNLAMARQQLRAIEPGLAG
ncbi:hypothetical protein [Fimbriiglobus ruber]|uniref:hypothetical protein n=1 Tax=Fimbriiglobus ruber TaxID=1908690 RepID=UPI003B84AC20